MSGPQAFNPRVVLGLLLFGALAFLATLYFIGTGETGRGDNDGGAHAAGKGLTGYAALAELLRADGHEVTLSRSAAALDDEGLLILTPSAWADPEEIEEAIEKRRFIGPTMVIMPKWSAMPIPAIPGSEAKEGWVQLGGVDTPGWPLELENPFELHLGAASGEWSGLGFRGSYPDASQVLTGSAPLYVPLIGTADGKALAAYLADGDGYPMLESAAGNAPTNAEVNKWAVVVLYEPDLANNYGFASESRANVAHELVDLAMEGEDLPITFDLTLNGLGRSQNLLTLAFTPPFLAATLCLILALLVVGWRAFRRFGPAVAEGRAIAFGKARLVLNSAGFILRTRRLHLLTAPYAEMLRQRIAHALALRGQDDEAIDAALARRAPDAPRFSTSAAALRDARSPSEILRAAAALRSIERKLAP